MGRISGLACVGVVATVAIGCKPQQVGLAETYERETCACAHHDLACVRAAESRYEDAHAKIVSHWYERKLDLGELQGHEDGAKQCRRGVIKCSPDDPCGPSRACVGAGPEGGVGVCVPVVKEGEACGGGEGSVCGEGMYCDQSANLMLPADQCWPTPCPGKCVKGTPPPDGLGILMGSHPSASASASASN